MANIELDDGESKKLCRLKSTIFPRREYTCLPVDVDRVDPELYTFNKIRAHQDRDG